MPSGITTGTRASMSKKLVKITSADVDRILLAAAAVRDDMIDAMVLIGAGSCEALENPMLSARKCMNTSRVFADAAAHLLSQAERQERMP